MKQVTFVLLTALITFVTYGQERKDLVLSVSGGKLTSPYYLKNTSGRFFSIDFDYYLSKRHILSANYNDGDHNYYDNILSTDPFYIKSDGTNSKANYHTFSVLYKYKFLNGKSILGSVGTGAGLMTHTKLYPFAINNGSNFREAIWTDLVFPVRLELDYRLPPNFKVGIIGGLFIHPDFPVLAYHVGPRLSYVLK